MISSCRLLKGMPEPRESFPVTVEDSAFANQGAIQEVAGGDDPISEAYARGYQEGYAACMAATNAEIEKQINGFKSMVEDLASQRSRLVRESEEAVLRLVCAISSRIVGKVAEIKEDLIGEVVRNAVSRLAERQRIVIRVNPQDAEVLKRQDQSWLASYDAVEIRPDPRIKRGGCLVEGEFGIVDAELDRQIEVIEKALIGASK